MTREPSNPATATPPLGEDGDDREQAVRSALASVNDPEIRRPITELGMVKSVTVRADEVEVGIWLTIATCPLRDEITSRVTGAVQRLPWVASVVVELDVMSDEQRTALREQLRGPTRQIPFTAAGNLTRVVAVASGKGGVGKSSLTVNLAVAAARLGRSVGILDADVYGHSIPRMLGIDRPPTVIDSLLMPPTAYGVGAMSMLPFKRGGVSEAVAFRGPMLHRTLEQFLTDVWWGDLDLLLLDLPPGTGDVAISTAQLLPDSELLIVTTPQPAAAEVAVRAGSLSAHTGQRVIGVVENMSALPCPHCGEPIALFGSGGGSMVATALTRMLGREIGLLGRIPFDVRMREGGDAGTPIVVSDPRAPAAEAISALAAELVNAPRGLVGRPLGLSPA